LTGMGGEVPRETTTGRSDAGVRNLVGKGYRVKRWNKTTEHIINSSRNELKKKENREKNDGSSH